MAPKRKTEGSTVDTVVDTAPKEESSILSDIDKLVKRLEGKGAAELENLRSQALIAETDLKREITILRQRAANMASTAETKIEEEIIQVKKELANALNWLRAIEQKLTGN